MSATIQNELKKTYGSENVTVEKDGDTYTVAITGKGTYKIEANGKVEKQGPAVSYANERIVESSDGTGTTILAATKTPGDKLYIYFEASVEGGTTSISPGVPFEISQNGTYNFTITSTVNGETFTTTKTYTADQYDLRAGIDVGDYVNYTPTTASAYSKTYLGETYTGSTGNTSDLTQETLKWRVLTKYPDGKLDLIADPTSAKVYFEGATGYNNGVYIMHDICEKLYSNIDRSITARSVSLEDFENNMTDAGRTARDEYNKNSTDYPQYGHTNYEKWGNAYTNRYYPNLYAKENGSGLESTTVKIDGINVSDKDELDLTTGTSAYKQAPVSPGLTTKQTFYNIDINSTNYGNASIVLRKHDSYTYWMASRFVYCFSSEAYFGIYRANISLDTIYMLESNGSTRMGSNNRLRPVVTLGADVQIIKSNTASSATGTPHAINW